MHFGTLVAFDLYINHITINHNIQINSLSIQYTHRSILFRSCSENVYSFRSSAENVLSELYNMQVRKVFPAYRRDKGPEKFSRTRN